MLDWSIEELKLELRYTWKISRNSSDHKTNFIIHVKKGGVEGLGEVAPNIRYNETPETIKSQFIRFLTSNPEQIRNITELNAHLDQLSLHNALRFGIESAYVHYLAAVQKTDVCNFLGVPRPAAMPTSFSLPIMDVHEVESFYQRNKLQRFARLKLKVNADNGVDLLREIHRISRQPLIIDANEAWTDPDALLQFMEAFRGYNIELMEQPFPSRCITEYQYLKPQAPYPIIADESICDHADFDDIKTQFHGINMKLMKAGGYLNGISLIRQAQQHGLKTMIGCMVETSVGIASALRLAAGVDYIDLDGFLIVKNEPYGQVSENEGMLSLADSAMPAS